ncbi:hypothetical protein INR49_027478 [Caranx melampygus]|nr:hypothetical protein INR49_027478 [Caranx melampygus]
MLCQGFGPRVKREIYTSKEGGRESKRERAEVVGEAVADNMLSLCKNDRKAAITERESCCRHRGTERQRERERERERSKLCGENDEDLVSGDQNKELIKDEAAAHSQRAGTKHACRVEVRCPGDNNSVAVNTVTKVQDTPQLLQLKYWLEKKLSSSGIQGDTLDLEAGQLRSNNNAPEEVQSYLGVDLYFQLPANEAWRGKAGAEGKRKANAESTQKIPQLRQGNSGEVLNHDLGLPLLQQLRMYFHTFTRWITVIRTIPMLEAYLTLLLPVRQLTRRVVPSVDLSQTQTFLEMNGSKRGKGNEPGPAVRRLY